MLVSYISPNTLNLSENMKHVFHLSKGQSGSKKLGILV